MPTASKAPPRRTRRVENPFDARLEVRLYSTELAKLREEAKARGLTASDLVRSQLGNLISALPPQAPERPQGAKTDSTPSEAPTAVTAPPEAPAEADLAEAIAAVRGTSWGYAMLQIRLGKVTVGGEPWTAPMIPYEKLPEIVFNGEPLPIQAIEHKPAADGQ